MVLCKKQILNVSRMLEGIKNYAILFVIKTDKTMKHILCIVARALLIDNLFLFKDIDNFFQRKVFSFTKALIVLVIRHFYLVLIVFEIIVPSFLVIGV